MDETSWPEVSAVVAAAPYPVEVLPVDPVRGSECLSALGITVRSWLGAVVANCGGLLVDHGWLRVLGGGCSGLPAVALPATDTVGLTVAYDVMGGQFAWLPGQANAAPTVHYFGPEDLTWQDLELGYADWLHAMLGGSLTAFYAALRWPGWEAEVATVPPDQGISAWPPPFTREGKDLSAVSRKAIPLGELVSVYEDFAQQLGSNVQE
ncbi:MAG: DUF2625 family protein [Mycobacterium sp.]|nr:DUF2625 family protein [Mycobacterium sp.]